MSDIRKATDRMRALFPNESFEYGYIGNDAPWGDDRSWMIWCLSRHVKSGLYAGNKISINLGSTEDLKSINWDTVVRKLTEKILKAILSD